jgi:hypothetical protein
MTPDIPAIEIIFKRDEDEDVERMLAHQAAKYKDANGKPYDWNYHRPSASTSAGAAEASASAVEEDEDEIPMAHYQKHPNIPGDGFAVDPTPSISASATAVDASASANPVDDGAAMPDPQPEYKVPAYHSFIPLDKDRSPVKPAGSGSDAESESDAEAKTGTIDMPEVGDMGREPVVETKEEGLPAGPLEGLLGSLGGRMIKRIEKMEKRSRKHVSHTPSFVGLSLIEKLARSTWSGAAELSDINDIPYYEGHWMV